MKKDFKKILIQSVKATLFIIVYTVVIIWILKYVFGFTEGSKVPMYGNENIVLEKGDIR